MPIVKHTIIVFRTIQKVNVIFEHIVECNDGYEIRNSAVADRRRALRVTGYFGRSFQVIRYENVESLVLISMSL